MTKNSFSQFLISEDIKKALVGLSFDSPTKVQKEVIPLALEQNDLIVKAQTGSGKTAAFAIPICESIEWLENKPQALILTPTRELAVQIKEDFINIGRFKRVNAVAVYGRHPFSIEKTELKQKAHVVVGTPGRILDHIEKGTLPLSKLSHLVLDEADRMLDMGFLEQVASILKALPSERVTMMFSATIPDQIKGISSEYMKNPQFIDASEDTNHRVEMNHSFCFVEEEEKMELLRDITIIENPDSCIIFCGTKERVELVWKKLTAKGYRCGKIHGGMEQKDRLLAMRQFKRGAFSYLIATDVVARGIDVDNITLVINYDIPFNKDTYVHRVGRTGRAGKKGSAITFVTPTQTRYYSDIEETIESEAQIVKRPSKEEIALKRPVFEETMKKTPQLKKIKSDNLSKDITRLCFYGGKKKKLRATNFVFAISNLSGVTAEDIGIITIQDTLTYIEILNGKGPLVLKEMAHTKICGKQLKVRKVTS